MPDFRYQPFAQGWVIDAREPERESLCQPEHVAKRPQLDFVLDGYRLFKNAGFDQGFTSASKGCQSYQTDPWSS